ncbi:MAG TPA: DUF2955 domain-containing protein [Geminicoccus sp.]|uniref:DUF2955 domain-containing protein n=1 Tax=Geminicoccus sp. TaxID=2024832 RepID=UPI002C84959F|nr:DUF2955 domain-containing protein [Geminicoccus sp.]HWL71957.1 DUF2955 domain-containing protein [Geminicoccus sp.]
MSTEPVPGLSANDWRLACRMASGAFAGWTLATLLSLPYAAFYAVYPLVLIGLSPALDRHIALQFLVAAPTGMIAAGIMLGVFSVHPVLMTASYLAFVIVCFRLMTSPRRLFMFGAISLSVCSALVHYGSYPEVSWQQLFWAVGGSLVFSVASYLLSFAVFPDVEPRTPRAPPPRSAAQRHHLVLLCAVGATGSFVFFQIFEASDSLSAQMATVLILLGLSHEGIWSAGYARLHGSVVGSVHATLAQLAISGHSGFWPLTACVFLIGLLWFSADHARSRTGPGKGFAAVTALAILFGQLQPSDDLIQNSLYRGVSVVISISLMLVFILLLHHMLNRLPATRWSND